MKDLTTLVVCSWLLQSVESSSSSSWALALDGEAGSLSSSGSLSDSLAISTVLPPESDWSSWAGSSLVGSTSGLAPGAGRGWVAVPAPWACKSWVAVSAPGACKGWVATSEVPGPWTGRVALLLTSCTAFVPGTFNRGWVVDNWTAIPVVCTRLGPVPSVTKPEDTTLEVEQLKVSQVLLVQQTTY